MCYYRIISLLLIFSLLFSIFIFRLCHFNSINSINNRVKKKNKWKINLFLIIVDFFLYIYCTLWSYLFMCRIQYTLFWLYTNSCHRDDDFESFCFSSATVGHCQAIPMVQSGCLWWTVHKQNMWTLWQAEWNAGWQQGVYLLYFIWRLWIRCWPRLLGSS